MKKHGAVLLAVGLTLLLSVPLVVNPRALLRDDAMSNTALAHAVRRHGIPPPDPYLAGQPLHYHWAYNALAAGLSALSGLHPLTVMVVLGPLGLAVGLVSMARLVRRMGGGEGAAALGVALMLVGLNGWGWVFLTTRWLTGEAGVAASLGLEVSEFHHLLVRGYDMRLSFLASKALLATSYIWTLALVPVCLGALVRFLRGEGWRQGVALALALAAAAYANLLVGAVLLGMLAAGLLAWACLFRHEQDRGAARRALWGLGFVAVAAAAVVPYVVVAVGAAATRERLVTLAWPDARHLRGVALGLLPLWVCVALLGRPRRWGHGEAWLAFLAAGLAAAYLFSRAVDGVHLKYLFVVSIVLSAYVARGSAGLARWRVWALWVVAASAAPTTAVGLVQQACAPDEVRVTPGEAAVFAWIARHTPPETVLVSRGPAGRATLVPILAERDLYVPDRKGFHRAGRYDPALWRRRQAQMVRLYERGEMVAVLREIARQVGRPVVLVTRMPFTKVSDPRLRLLHAAGGMRAWRLEDRSAAPAEEGR